MSSVKNISFYDFQMENQSAIEYVTIATYFRGQWVFCRHKERTTWEIPGGKRKSGESILEAAKRELFEETGATAFQIMPLDQFDVHFESEQESISTTGLLCYAEVEQMSDLPESEIAEVNLASQLPSELTHPEIQPVLWQRVLQRTQIIERARPYKHIIWDWNGTIVDDVDIAVDSVSTLLEENSLPRVDVNTYKQVFGFPVKDYYEKLGFDLNESSFDRLSERFHEEYKKNKIQQGKIFSDVVHHLEFFSHTKRQSILSAGAQWHLEEWVDHFNLTHFFEHIYGIDNHFAASKVDRGHELMKRAQYHPQDTLLIGDTDHDAEVGRQLGIDVLLVANGHQSYERLAQIHDNVIESRH